MKLKVAFFGSPDFAASYLEQLLEDTSLPVEITHVFTQPDQPAGRKQTLTPTPVKLVAQNHNVPVSEDIDLSALKNIDLAIVYAYGKILPTEILNATKDGFLNIHPSLLPKYRGVAPMAYALLLGDTQTGVTLIKLDEEMDHGPIVAQETYDVSTDETRQDLEKNLTELAVKMTKHVLAQWDSVRTIEQDHEKATFTRFLNKNDGFIPFESLKKLLKNEELSPTEIPQIITEYFAKNNLPISDLSPNTSHLYFNLYRALYPWPGIWTFITIDGVQKRLKITKMNNQLAIEKVQLEGKNEVDFKTFNEAYKLF